MALRVLDDPVALANNTQALVERYQRDESEMRKEIARLTAKVSLADRREETLKVENKDLKNKINGLNMQIGRMKK